MEVNCEGCAGCCIDWRALNDAKVDHERRGRYVPLDDVGNLAPIRRDGSGPSSTKGSATSSSPDCSPARATPPSISTEPRWRPSTDGPHSSSACASRPKPVGPFDSDSTWLPTCAFLDPTTLQCRIHGDDLYPETCRRYPRREPRAGRGDGVRARGSGLRRVPADRRRTARRRRTDLRARGGRDDGVRSPRPRPADGRRRPPAERRVDPEDRAEFVAVAAASSPAMLAVSDPVYEETREQVLDADSWAGRAIDRWTDRAGDAGTDAPAPAPLAKEFEEEAGAPETHRAGTPSGPTVKATRPRLFGMRVLVTGATGFVGGRLVPVLLDRGHDVRVLVRDPDGYDPPEGVDVGTGDLLEPGSFDAALADVEAAYYLVHSMGSGGDFAERDRQAAANFARAAGEAGVDRVVYLGGLGEDDDGEGEELSAHLRSPTRGRTRSGRRELPADDTARRRHHRQGERELRDDPPARPAPPGDGDAALGPHAVPAHRHRRRHRLPGRPARRPRDGRRNLRDRRARGAGLRAAIMRRTAAVMGRRKPIILGVPVLTLSCRRTGSGS